jgi:hypothetical protein
MVGPLFNMGYILSCCFTMLYSWLGSFDILITQNNFLSWFKKLKEQHSVIKRFKKKQFTELSIDEFLRLVGIIFGY